MRRDLVWDKEGSLIMFFQKLITIIRNEIKSQNFSVYDIQGQGVFCSIVCGQAFGIQLDEQYYYHPSALTCVASCEMSTINQWGGMGYFGKSHTYL